MDHDGCHNKCSPTDSDSDSDVFMTFSLFCRRLYLMNDDLDACQYTCMNLLKNDAENEEATVMMADLAFRKNDYEAAMVHFQQVSFSPIDCVAKLFRQRFRDKDLTINTPQLKCFPPCVPPTYHK